MDLVKKLSDLNIEDLISSRRLKGKDFIEQKSRKIARVLKLYLKEEIAVTTTGLKVAIEESYPQISKVNLGNLYTMCFSGSKNPFVRFSERIQVKEISKVVEDYLKKSEVIQEGYKFKLNLNQWNKRDLIFYLSEKDLFEKYLPSRLREKERVIVYNFSFDGFE